MCKYLYSIVFIPFFSHGASEYRMWQLAFGKNIWKMICASILVTGTGF
jgi:hypothetical protein